MSLSSLVLVNEGSIESNSSTSTLTSSRTEVSNIVVCLFCIMIIVQYVNTHFICFYNR